MRSRQPCGFCGLDITRGLHRGRGRSPDRPLAFTGPAWDGEITAAYAGGKASMKRLFTLGRDTVIKGIAWRKLS